MYAKLVFRNAKRSVKGYLVYIVTMTICVTLFYAFLSISSSYYSPDIKSNTMLKHCGGSPKWLEAQSLQGTLLYGRSMPLDFCSFLAWQ